MKLESPSRERLGRNRSGPSRADSIRSKEVPAGSKTGFFVGVPILDLVDREPEPDALTKKIARRDCPPRGTRTKRKEIWVG